MVIWSPFILDELGNKLDSILGKFRQRGVLTEPMIRDGLREVRRVLLEADVNYKVTRGFVERVQESALGKKVIGSVSPGQQIVKIVHDELANLLGEIDALEKQGLFKWLDIGAAFVFRRADNSALQGRQRTATITFLDAQPVRH